MARIKKAQFGAPIRKGGYRGGCAATTSGADRAERKEARVAEREYKKAVRVAGREERKAERAEKKAPKAQAGKSVDSSAIYKKRAEDAGNKLMKADVRDFGKNIKDFAKKQAESKRYERKGKPGYDEQGNRKPLSSMLKLKKGQAGLKASNKRVGPVDPKGAWTKVQEMTLAGKRTPVSLKKDKQLGATKMKMGGKLSKKK
jgi:hypothetical protein